MMNRVGSSRQPLEYAASGHYNSKQLTQDLKQASLGKIKDIWERNKRNFNLFHYSAALSQLKNIASKSKQKYEKTDCLSFSTLLADRLAESKLEYIFESIANISSTLQPLNIRAKALFHS